MEHLVSLVCSRGLLRSCDSHNREPVSSHPAIDADLVQAHRPGGSIYVCTDALKNFAQNFLPQIREPFVLVSGDSDVPVSAALLEDEDIRRILQSDWLIGWHAQNLMAEHPRLHAMPIGLDYHTMWARPGFWGLSAVSPMAQEHLLLSHFAASPEFNQRYMNAYCNWHFAMGRGDRQECLDRVDKSICFFEPSAVTRNSTWLRQAECMFVLSPEGAGMDCHRTWEALLLGCVPIVKKNPLASLFADLPVLVVEDWADVTRDTLLAYAGALPARQFNFSTLFRDHWSRRISGARPAGMAPMGFADFRRLLTRKTG